MHIFHDVKDVWTKLEWYLKHARGRTKLAKIVLIPIQWVNLTLPNFDFGIWNNFSCWVALLLSRPIWMICETNTRPCKPARAVGNWVLSAEYVRSKLYSGERLQFRMRVFRNEYLKASWCSRQGEGTPRAPGKVRVVDGQVGQVRLG